jgi:hypothetical protein
MAQNLSCVGEGVYESKFPTNTLTNYNYERNWTLVSIPNARKAEMVLTWNTGQIGVKFPGPKPTFKTAVKYKYKVHTSDHTARNNNINYGKRMIHN